MGEVLFSLFIGGYLAAVGLFYNWYLRREEKRVNSGRNAGQAEDAS